MSPEHPDYGRLPPHIRGGVKRYIEEYIPPGDFLQAVICNKLKESFMYADDINIDRMFSIVNFFYNDAPLICWGSEERMNNWLRRRMFERGVQIIYKPLHVCGTDDPDCEPGFVMSVDRDGAFCRYWSKQNLKELRTIANSEKTPFDLLVIEDTRSQFEVDRMIKLILDQPEVYGVTRG